MGVILSVAAALGTFRYTRVLEAELASARASLAALGDTVEIPVPKADTARGGTLLPADFRVLTLPAANLPENVLKTLPPVSDTAPLVALTDLAAGDLLLTGALAEAGANPDLGLLVSPGGHAFAVAPRNLADFDGLLAVGAPVDLIWTRNLGGGQTESRMIGSALRILALPQPGESGALTGKLVLEGEAGSEGMLAYQAEEIGYFHILLSDGVRKTSMAEVAVGPGDLADLPLVVRQGGGAAEDGVIAKITGASDDRTTCTTAVVRGGGRSLMEVPC